MERKSGILMHISSLANDYGIGSFGKCAYDFVEFLSSSKQHYWQILPICPTGYGDSPYSSYTTSAINPYFIDLDLLIEEGLLKKRDVENIKWSNKVDEVDYGLLYEKRYPILRKAMKKFLKKDDESFIEFKEKERDWLKDYALFMSLKTKFGGNPWYMWPSDFKNHDEIALDDFLEKNKAEYDFWCAIEYFAYKQWNNLKKYANDRDIEFIGDLPIYVAYDSVDVWSHSELFELDEDKNPIEISGVPPDGFSEDGQRWGNPLYDWKYHKKTKFKWWIERIYKMSSIYDVLRIDHFRGFASYYAIAASEDTARNGRWRKGYGSELFKTLKKVHPDIRIIAEDLGYLTEEVFDLLEETGFPGMKILQFAFDKREESHINYLPFNYPKNSIAYTGTHDNDTIKGWLKNANKEDIDEARAYMMIKDDEDFIWTMLGYLMMSSSDICILQAQDILELDETARMNTPSTSGNNWKWRAKKRVFTKKLAKRLASMTERYYRI